MQKLGLDIIHVGDKLVVLVLKKILKQFFQNFHIMKNPDPPVEFPPSFLSAPAGSSPLGARQPTILTLPIVAYSVFTAHTFNTVFYHVFYAL